MIKYSLIEIYTSEDIHWKGKPLYFAIMEAVRNLKTAARCIITRSLEGCYENGEIASSRFEILSIRLPLKIEVLLPEAEIEKILPSLKTMVTDGIITVRDANVISYRTEKHLIPRYLYVRDIMTKNPVSAKPDAPISKIIWLLIEKELCSIPIVNEHNEPIGIITETDLIKKVNLPLRLGFLSHFNHRIHELQSDYDKIVTKEIMSTPVYSIPEDEYLVKAVDLLLRYNIKRLLVVNKDGNLSGILSISDIFRAVTVCHIENTALLKHIEFSNVKIVSDVMFSNCPKVFANAPIEDVIQCIDTSPLQRVAVVDSSEKLVGMIYDHDLLNLLSEHKDTIWDHLLGAISFTEIGRLHKDKIRHLHAENASDIMRKDIIAVPVDAPVDIAIRLISENDINYLPVIDRDGVFKGVISREALLRSTMKAG